MSTEIHSPGPWKIDWNIVGGGVHPTLPHLHYASINSKDEALHITGYVRKPDLHLIAAAPDLLELAKQYASECAQCHGTGVVSRQIGGDGYGDRCAAIADVEATCSECEDVRAVIDKAEGKS